MPSLAQLTGHTARRSPAGQRGHRDARTALCGAPGAVAARRVRSGPACCCSTCQRPPICPNRVPHTFLRRSSTARTALEHRPSTRSHAYMTSLCCGPACFVGLLQPPAVKLFPASSAGKRSTRPNCWICRLTFPNDINGPGRRRSNEDKSSTPGQRKRLPTIARARTPKAGCRPPATWDHLEVSSARSMGPPAS
jgi:hypothetical protein